jgi:hypothetical protein
MNQHPDFTNLNNIGMEVVRQDRHAIAHRSVLAQGDLFRIIFGASSERHAAAAFGGPRRRNANAGLLLAEFDRLVAALPLLKA